jgi:hypothetical protein
MSDEAQNFMDQIKAGKPDLAAIEKMSTEPNQRVSISDWKLCYSGFMENKLTGYCTLTAKDPADKITSVGIIISETNTSPMLCYQLTGGFNEPVINASVGTNFYTPGVANLLCFVYGWTQSGGSGFSFYQTLPVESCQ